MLAPGYVMTTPAESLKDCDGTYFVFKSAEGDAELRVRFDSQPSCVRVLTTVTLSSKFEDMTSAERERVSLIDKLKLGGLPTIHEDSFRYLWRSNDSHTRYDLSLRVASELGAYHLNLRLVHEDVQPKDVDYSPFERGFMGCNSSP